jgi:hypothetical protein
LAKNFNACHTKSLRIKVKNKKGAIAMRRLTIVLFLSLMTFVDFASAESIVIGPKIGITYPLSL